MTNLPRDSSTDISREQQRRARIDGVRAAEPRPEKAASLRVQTHRLKNDGRRIF